MYLVELEWNWITIGRQPLLRGNKERLEFLKNLLSLAALLPGQGGRTCQMNMTDASLIAMRREIRVDKVYLSTSKQFEIKFSIGSRRR